MELERRNNNNNNKDPIENLSAEEKKELWIAKECKIKNCFPVEGTNITSLNEVIRRSRAQVTHDLNLSGSKQQKENWIAEKRQYYNTHYMAIKKAIDSQK